MLKRTINSTGLIKRVSSSNVYLQWSITYSCCSDFESSAVQELTVSTSHLAVTPPDHIAGQETTDTQHGMDIDDIVVRFFAANFSDMNLICFYGIAQRATTANTGCA